MVQVRKLLQVKCYTVLLVVRFSILLKSFWGKYVVLSVSHFSTHNIFVRPIAFWKHAHNGRPNVLGYFLWGSPSRLRENYYQHFNLRHHKKVYYIYFYRGRLFCCLFHKIFFALANINFLKMRISYTS